ncbi:MAG: exonuclease SbcCD subunit D [Lachnospiraceae bacterium]
MKLMHLSDLHLGKRIYEANFIEEQEYILEEIKIIIQNESVEGILIAGDIYDKAVPPVEAIRLFDSFLTFCAGRGLPLCIISGNHDSAERISFASDVLVKQEIYFSPVYDGNVRCVTLKDGYGEICIHMLPFLKPAHVKHIYPEAEVENYEQAIRVVLAHMKVDLEKRNVLMLHQFVAGAETCESEELLIGGLEQIPASLFGDFDYVALGHLHGPQQIGRETVRYCGTPLKYSFSEAAHQKSVSIVEFAEKGAVAVRTVPLVPLHDMRCMKGSYLKLTARETYRGTAVKDYLQITLTDEEDIPDAIGKLRAVYPNVLKLTYDNTRTRNQAMTSEISEEQVQKRTPLEFLEELYRLQNHREMSEQQKHYSEALFEKIWEESDEAK